MELFWGVPCFEPFRGSGKRNFASACPYDIRGCRGLREAFAGLLLKNLLSYEKRYKLVIDMVPPPE